MSIRGTFPLGIAAAIALAGCGKSNGSASCGLDALTTPLAIKQSFMRGYMLTSPPDSIPARIPVRVVAGPAWSGTIVKQDSTWSVTTQGKVSHAAEIGYGVLVVGPRDSILGILAFDGRSIRGAGVLGTLNIADTIVPLLGVRFDLAAVEDYRCPLFPDSLR